MSEALLISLLRLFAYISVLHTEVLFDYSRSFIEILLRKEMHLQGFDYYLKLYGKFYNEFLFKQKELPENDNGTGDIHLICTNLISDLHLEQRITIIAQLLQFSKYYQKSQVCSPKTEVQLEHTIHTIAAEFSIDNIEFRSLCDFIYEDLHMIEDKKNLIIVGKSNILTDIKFIKRKSLAGQIFFLYLPSVKQFAFYYNGDEALLLNNTNIFPHTLYFFQRSSIISSENLPSLYYHELNKYYLEGNLQEPITVSLVDVEYKFRNSDNGIKKLTLHGESGELLGIMGSSGTGKSTLMNILTGSIKPQKGAVYINGYSIDQIRFQNLIGYVPQDDLLFEELSVYRNLYFSAKLCFKTYSDAEVEERVNRMLQELDLSDVRDMKVGSPLKKYISGGQRKRLNIALELIREPSILLLDEPTSGLSSSDAEKIIRLLCEQTKKGKYVVINIHQPSSMVYKQLDQLLILDKGGYPVYYGKAMEAIKYFKNIAKRINSELYECEHCGNINPEDIFRIIEERKIDAQGEYLNQRKVEPAEWYQYYVNSIEAKEPGEIRKTTIPETHFKIAGRVNQFLVFMKRQVLSRFSDRQYLTMILLISPALGFILGYFCKYAAGVGNDPAKYLFIDNQNLPVYLFMSVISSLFVGMIISAEEIHRDRKIRERERFLSLSNGMYYNSKVLYLFIISAFQVCLFLLVGNTILQIRGMGLTYGLILFSTSCFATMIGLNISAAFNSLVAIYIMIPLMLVPHILLSGVIVPFDKLNNSLKSEKYVPVIGDLMVTRWAYEALAVEQFRNNEYQRIWFRADQEKSNTSYVLLQLIPTLSTLVEESLDELTDNIIDPDKIKSINYGLTILNTNIHNSYNYSLSYDHISRQSLNAVYDFFDKCKPVLSKRLDEINRRKDMIYDSLLRRSGQDAQGLLDLKQKYFNTGLADYVLRRNTFNKIIIQNGEIIRKIDPIYYESDNLYGRAHFYAPAKRIRSVSVSTYYFNIAVIWLMSLFLYLLLITNALRWFIVYAGKRMESMYKRR